MSKKIKADVLPALWVQAAEKFEASAYKDVKFGRGFTTIDAYHVIERLTEMFGLCGQGWGVEVERYELRENNCAAIGHLWYCTEGDELAKVIAVGDAMVVNGNIAEAYKKAQTNLISKAASFLGVGISVYQGKGIDDPYLDRAAAANQAPQNGANSTNGTNGTNGQHYEPEPHVNFPDPAAGEAGSFDYTPAYKEKDRFKADAKAQGISVEWDGNAKVWRANGDIKGWELSRTNV